MPKIGLGNYVGRRKKNGASSGSSSNSSWMFATQWNIVNNSKSTVPTGKLGYISRSAHFTGSKPLKKLKFGWHNFHVGSSSTGAATAPGNDFPLIDASVEYKGVTYPIKFSSSRSINIGDGLMVWSDEIDIQSVMGVASIPVDSRLDIKFMGLLTAAGQSVEASAPRGNTVISGQQTYFYNPTNVVMGSTDAPGQYTWSYINGGTAGADVAATAAGWVPFVIGVHTEAPDVWLAFGDSLTAGTGDSGTNNSGIGWFQRAIGMMTVKPAAFNFSVHGSTRKAGLTDTRVTDLFSMCNLAVAYKGANDFGTTGISILPQPFLDDMLIFKTKALAAGISTVGIVKTTPRSNSTDNWVTELNQTPLSGWTLPTDYPLVYNTLLPGGFDWSIPMDTIRGTVIPYNIRAGDAFDTTHFNASGNTHMAQEAYPIMQTKMLR